MKPLNHLLLVIYSIISLSILLAAMVYPYALSFNDGPKLWTAFIVYPAAILIIITQKQIFTYLDKNTIDMKNWITLLWPSKKPKHIMPNPDFQDNWKAEFFEINARRGVEALQKGNEARIMDDGRGFELALEIKRRFIAEYSKQMAERIIIEHGNSIISIKIKTNLDL